MPVIIEEFDSQALQGNPLSDPTTRKIPVYLPPSYATNPEKRYPVVYMLHGFTGNSQMWLNVNSYYTLTVPERYQCLIEKHVTGEMILVFPDGFNSLGGSQYLNSVATGRYEDYIINDLVPYIDGKFRTLSSREHRAVVGKSSGGYGSVRLAMRHPETFSAMGSHSGDMYFELCYKPDFPKVVRAFTHHLSNPNPIGSYLTEFAQAEVKKSSDIEAMNILAMAACYSPREETMEPSFDLPFDLHTGELKQEIWERWLEHDPIYMLQKPEYAEAMRSMKLIYLDAGTKDEFNLHLGARIFASRLKQLDIKHHHEEFEGGHFNINYRYDTSLTHIWKAIGE